MVLPVPAVPGVLVPQSCFNVPDNHHVINQLLYFCRCPCCMQVAAGTDLA